MPHHRPRRPAPWIVAVLGVLVALVIPTAALPGTCAAAAGELRVSVVIDDGSGAGAVCVTVPSGSTGADVLVERARVLGTPAPRWDGSGLLCALDGVPASGCGERTDDGYLYWSYWRGDTGTWQYSSVGPATRRVSAGAVEGWRFVAGAGNPTDPPPRHAPDADAICGTTPPPTTPTTAPPAPTTPPPSAAPSPAPTGAAGEPTGGSSAPASGTAPATTVGSSTGSAAAGPVGTDETGAGPSGADPSGGAAPDAGGATAASGDPAGEGTAASGGAGAGETAAPLPVSSRRDDNGGFPLSTLLGVVLLATLGAGAVVRSRRAPARG